MARRGNGNGRRQGVVSWLLNVVTLLFGLYPFWVEVANLFKGASLAQVGSNLSNKYNPLSPNKAEVQASYGTLIGALIFHTVARELMKRVRIKSIIPALR